MHRILTGFLLTALLAAPLRSLADEQPAVLVDFGYASRYVSRGVVRADSSAQASVELARDQFSGGLWTNGPFQSDGTREVNLHGTYTWQPTKTLTLAATATHAWLSDVPGDAVKSTFETGLTATLAAIGGYVPSLSYAHEFRQRSDSTQVALARSVPLTGLGVFLELEAFAGCVTGNNWRPDTIGPRRQDSYAYWGGSARVPYRIGLHSTVIAGLQYADTSGRSALNGPFGQAEGHNFWITLGVNLDF